MLEYELWGNTLESWGISILIIVGAVVVVKLISLFSRKVLKPFITRTPNHLDNVIYYSLESPIKFAVMLLGIWIAIHRLVYPDNFVKTIDNAYRILIVLDITWVFARLIGGLLEIYLRKESTGQPHKMMPIDKATYDATLGFFDALLRLLHPFMPFITEELWQALEPHKDGESLMVALMPEVAPVDNAYLDAFEVVKEIVSGVRTIRLQKNIPNKDTLALQVLGDHNDAFNPVIAKMCNLSEITKTDDKAAGAVSFLVRTTEYAVPLGNMINVEEELAKLAEELKYQQGFLASVQKKLSNESFVSKAPAKVIEMERKKQADAESKIKSIEESIAALKK